MEEENKQHDEEMLPAPIDESEPHKKGDKIDPAIEWEGVEGLSDNELDFSALKDLDMLEVLEEAEQEARLKKRAAIEMQGMIALKAIINEADPIEVARRCGFDISDPDEMHERKPSGVPKEMWAQRERTGNRAQFFRFLMYNFEKVMTKKLEADEDA